jgi:hypothetical protein
VTDPKDAVEQARASAASMRAAGAYRDEPDRYELAPEPISATKLFEWAVIEPDLREVRSTRRFGAPMTAFKRLLLRLLAQYHAELLAQQTRFNVNVVAHLRTLERRIEQLERSHEKDAR